MAADTLAAAAAATPTNTSITARAGSKDGNKNAVHHEFSDSHFQAFKRDGCAVISNFLGADEIASLRTRISTLLDAFDPTDHPMTTFATGTRDDQHIGDQYFFDSSDKTHYFLEEDAVANGQLVVDARRAINKIGHGLHIDDPAFNALTHSERVRHIARELGYEDPRVLQSMVICKQPKIGGAVPLHQDSTFLFTRPLSACGFWIALEDCTLTNGCLEVIPGSHLSTPITRRFVRTRRPSSATDAEKADTPGGNKMVDIESVFSLFPPVRDSGKTEPPAPNSDALPECIPIEVKAGTLVLIHGQVLHRSSHNHSNKSRWIYTFHIVDGTYDYDERNWLQMPVGTQLTKL
ncbi:hypothetical protein BX661DRAFT_156550 [Kickxella alabastrina]|uniref:uncharacterized protein n=1 Tax=Kickxella alabastrina TaxID=61397 RepID=UPI00221E6A7F|nr:uncharacterized protein BX661DRAFT_156550 [Kickxella alabastrina]KAI7821431.1 hypothetical protein BX661DRAFT_156550 [Kickxella alabastrina]